MKKKLLSMLLISAMCLSTAGDTVLAASADFELDVQAENEDFLTGSVELTDGTDEDSEVSEPGAPDDGNSGEDAGLGDGEDSGLGDGIFPAMRWSWKKARITMTKQERSRWSQPSIR